MIDLQQAMRLEAGQFFKGITLFAASALLNTEDLQEFINGNLEIRYSFLPRYAVSNTGRVFDLKKLEEILPWNNGKGYWYITGYIDTPEGKIKKNFKTSRLVAMSYCEYYINGEDVDHIDYDKENNSAKNLQFLTHKQNIQRRRRGTK